MPDTTPKQQSGARKRVRALVQKIHDPTVRFLGEIREAAKKADENSQISLNGALGIVAFFEELLGEPESAETETEEVSS